MAEKSIIEAPLQAQTTEPTEPRVANLDRITIQTPPVRPRQTPAPPDLKRVSSILIEDHEGGFHRDRPRLYRRYVLLRSQQMFTRLLDIYQSQISASYRSFKQTIEAFTPTPAYANNHARHAAACYISAWFWDLWVSNRNSVEKLSATAYMQHYMATIPFVMDRYDPFLQHLLCVIKPTHTSLSLEDTLYIPLLCESVNFASTNPFGINGFVENADLVQGLLDQMDANNNKWRTVPIAHDTMGRPGWLFDWRLNSAYAWFPQEGHFSDTDLAAPYILGIPCTPRLGPRDLDDWQFFAGNVVPNNLTNQTCPRGTNRNFYGAAEYRTIALRQWELPMATIDETTPSGSKRQATRAAGTRKSTLTIGGSAVEPSEKEKETECPLTTYQQYQVIDWCYHGRVIFNVNIQRQNQMLRSILFG